MMARPASAIKAFGLTALVLLACNGPFATAATTSMEDSTTGGAPDAGTVTMTDDYADDPCDNTPAPMGPNDTPAPAISNRCIPIATSYEYYREGDLAAPAAVTPAPSEPEATPEPTLTGGGGGGGGVVAEPSATPATTMPTTSAPEEGGGGAGGDATDAPPTSAPTPAATTADGDRDVVVDVTPAPVEAGAIPSTAAPTNEDGQTAGDETDGASGLAPPGAVVAAAAFGFVLAAAVLAA